MTILGLIGIWFGVSLVVLGFTKASQLISIR
jgi:hypothetical protein